MRKLDPWLRYSQIEDAAYCKYCMIFAGNVTLFGKALFTEWKNAICSSLKLHEESKDHIDDVKASNDFLVVCEKVTKSKWLRTELY